MVKRLVMDITVPTFKLSKAGVDVDTATGEDLIFDIAQGKMTGVYTQNVVNTGNFTYRSTDPNGYINSWSQTIYLGKIFAFPPQFTYHIKFVSGSSVWVENSLNQTVSAPGGYDYPRIAPVITTATLELYYIAQYLRSVDIYYVIYQV